MCEEFLNHSVKTEAVLKEMKAKNERTLTFNPATLILETLSSLLGLGQILQNEKQSQTVGDTTQDTFTIQPKPNEHYYKLLSHNYSFPLHITRQRRKMQCRRRRFPDANQVIKLEKSKMFRVRMRSDSHICLITGICETVAGLLTIDSKNKNIKLLDKNYKVVANCELPGIPESIYSIDSSLVAVTVCNNEVHFIRLTYGQLVHEERTMKLQHSCKCIVHHKGSLYITSGAALYQYTMEWRQVCKMYKDKSRYSTVTSCAISPDGDRIYVTNQDCSKLVTLSRNGKVISTLSDPALKLPFTFGHNPLHVTGSGQVLVCNADFNTVLQVDEDGKQILAEVVAGKDGLRTPLCVYYRKHTGTLVVGMMANDNIIVFTKP